MKLPPGYVAGVGVQKATAYGGLGQRLMERMGWSKGQGLGKEKHGMKAAIEVKKKEDTLGVGANAASWNWEQKYWEDAYNSAIQNINHETSSSGGSDSSSSDSDSDVRRRGKRARKVATFQGATVTAAGAAAGGGVAVTVNRDGTIASASAAELRIAAELAKDPWGRWGGRAGKMARIRAQEQEEANRARAKLGLPPLPVAEAQAPGDESDDSSSSSGGDGPSTSGRDAAANGGNTGRSRKGGEKGKSKKDKGSNGQESQSEKEAKMKKDKKKRAATGGCDADAADAQDTAAPAKPAPKRIVVVLGSEAANAARIKMFASFKPTPATGWWGAKMFHSVGLMESLEDEAAGEQRLAEAAERRGVEVEAGRVALPGAAAVAAGQRRGFNEDDQAALYKRAQDFQRVGRRGLGKAEIKVGGAKWEGTKKTFGDDEEEEEEGEGTVAVAYPGEDGGKEGKKGKKRRAGISGEHGTDEQHEKKAKKERRRLEQQQGEEAAVQETLDVGTVAAGEGAAAARKSKRRKVGDGASAPEAGGAAGSEEATPADKGSSDAAAAAGPKPKWLKLARMVLRKSAERRVKLRKVVAELVLAAEEHHRQHRHKHRKEGAKAKKASADAAADAGAEGPSPWDHDNVRDALERKIRKSNSGLAIDGKFLTMSGKN